MSKFKFEIVWEIMKKFDFHIGNEFESDFLCVLCKKLLINAYISPCACRFCFNCISDYLNQDNKTCPGNTNDCKIELLCLNENVVVDHGTNNKILKLKVKCPENSCNFKDELKNIEEHIRICNYRPVSCPYLNIGCNSSNMHAGNIGDHLQLEIGNHTKLLIDCIDNLNNEIGKLKISVDKLGEENKVLKSEINEMKLDGEKKQSKCDEQDREIDLLNEDMVALRNVDKYMRDDFDELKLDGERKQIEIDKLNKKLQEMELRFEIEIKSNIEKEFDELKLDGERKEKEFEKLERKCDEQTRKIDLLNEEIIKLRNVDKLMREDLDKLKLNGERDKKSIELLEKKCEQQNKQIEQFNNKYQQIENKFINVKQERENKEKDLMRNIDEMKNKQIEMTTSSNKIDETMKNVENKLLEIEINQNKMNYGEFVWRIDKINDKMKDAKNGINKTIYSDLFYTHKHGYKMCLCVDPDGIGSDKGTHLSLFFFLMKGEFDDILQWPFKHDVTFSLINQQTRLVHVSWTTKYDNNPNCECYKKPINERNIGRGFHKFIKLSELSTSANLILNNQIFIKCSVNIPS